MNLERTKPEQLAAGVMDYMPQSLAAHEYAERLNAALARLGLTDRLTLPPAPNTAIDELPGVVDVPLRKTLSVLMGKAQQGDASALATLEWTAQVAESIFAGLHARDFAGDRPLALPSHESLATLSQGVDALLPRKISNGAWSLLADGTPSDGIDDGVSLVRLFCTDAINSVTELHDDNEGWVMTKSLTITLGAPKVVINCIETLQQGYDTRGGTLCPIDAEYHFTSLKRIVPQPSGVGFNQQIVNCNAQTHDVYMPELEEIAMGSRFGICGGINSTTLNEPYSIYMPKLNSIGSGSYIFRAYNQCTTGAERVILGAIKTNLTLVSGNMVLSNLIHLEFGQGTSASLNLAGWNPTSVLSDSERLPIFLSNFKTYIAERVEDRTGKAALTLTLSAAVYEALEAQEGQTIIATLTNKNWTVASA